MLYALYGELEIKLDSGALLEQGRMAFLPRQFHYRLREKGAIVVRFEKE